MGNSAVSLHADPFSPRLPVPARARPAGRPSLVASRSQRFEAARRSVLNPLEEVRGFDARGLCELPCVTVLELEVPGWSGPVWVRTDDRRDDRALATGSVVLRRSEWLAIVEAAEQDRLYLHDLRAALRVATEQGGLLEADALVGPIEREAPRNWTVGRVLEQIGARLFSVRVEQPDPPAAELAANTLLAVAS